MKDIELAERIEDATGEWIAHRCGMEFLIRGVPAPEIRRMNKKYLGRDRKVTHTQAGRVVNVDTDKTDGFQHERACLALVDSRPGADPDASFRIAGDALAAKFAKALDKPVKSGDRIKLHGEWTLAAKELVFAMSTALRDWVNERAQEVEGEEAEEEAGKENS